MEGPLTWGEMLVPGQAGNQPGRKQLYKRGPENFSGKQRIWGSDVPARGRRSTAWRAALGRALAAGGGQCSLPSAQPWWDVAAALGPVLGSQHEKDRLTGVMPPKGHRDDWGWMMRGDWASRRGGWGRCNQCPLTTGSKYNGGRLFTAVGSDTTGGNRHTFNRGRFHVSIRKKLCCDGGQMLEQIFQKGCRDSILGNIQSPVVLGSLL